MGPARLFDYRPAARHRRRAAHADSDRRDFWRGGCDHSIDRRARRRPQSHRNVSSSKCGSLGRSRKYEHLRMPALRQAGGHFRPRRRRENRTCLRRSAARRNRNRSAHPRRRRHWEAGRDPRRRRCRGEKFVQRCARCNRATRRAWVFHAWTVRANRLVTGCTLVGRESRSITAALAAEVHLTVLATPKRQNRSLVSEPHLMTDFSFRLVLLSAILRSGQKHANAALWQHSCRIFFLPPQKQKQDSQKLVQQRSSISLV